MKNSLEISNELKEISKLLAELEKVNVFTVPEGYFDKLNERIADFAIFNSQDEFNSNKKNVHKVPEGYFQSLSTEILAKIKELYPETVDEELRKLSPMLHSLKSRNVFTVPNGYFQSLTDYVIGRLQPAQAKVVVMKPPKTWLKIAAAAVVTGIIAISSLQVFYHSSNPDKSKPAITASANMPGYVRESFQFKTEAQLDAGIAKLSDDDIIKYLVRNGNVMDNDLLLKNTDVSGLPDEADYLTNENTLNIYLDKIEGEGKAE